MRWFTSDLHLGHTNIIKYCDRPFSEAGVMNAALVAGWNTLVGHDDEVWVLGDLAMGRIDEMLPIAGKLVGTKHLVVGNHDRPFEDGSRRAEWTGRYMGDAGFVEILHGETTLELSDGSQVRLCHFPYSGDSRHDERYLNQRPVDDGTWLLHGHVHDTWRQHGHMINVGVDAWSGVPVSEEAIIGLIEAGEADLPRFEWT